jgi:hypothetical protein
MKLRRQYRRAIAGRLPELQELLTAFFIWFLALKVGY